MFPNEVAGMVLIDAAHEDEPKRAPRFMLGRTLPPALRRPLHVVVRAVWRVGLIRLFVRPSSSPRTPEATLEALRRQPKAIATLAGDGTAPESCAQAHAAPGLGDRPLIVLTRGRLPEPSGDAEIDRQTAAYAQVWMHELQPQLARLSSRGRQVIVRDSGHHIPDDAPKAVIDAVRTVVAESRRDRVSLAP